MVSFTRLRDFKMRSFFTGYPSFYMDCTVLLRSQSSLGIRSEHDRILTEQLILVVVAGAVLNVEIVSERWCMMIGTNTVNTRWGAKVEASIRRRWQLLRSESNQITKRIAWSYQRFAKKGLQTSRPK